MGTQLKKVVKKRKQLQKLKKKKRARKMGLGRYVEPPKQPKKSTPKPETEEDIEAKKVAKRQIAFLRRDDKKLSLVDRCKQQMSASLLRIIDESLYTSDTSSVPLDKDRFIAYHEAYEKACERWPTKPIDFIVKFIKKRLLAKKHASKLKFADVGCGREPGLKNRLPSKTKVVSFDLVSMHEDITEANMESLPLDDESIHCAVYSLSLMAKNLGKVILEAKRILKPGGSMVIVEVTSRFEGRERRFLNKMEKLGFKQKSTAKLPPNGYFTFFHFGKTDSRMDYSQGLLDIQLKPCVYKTR